MKTRRIEYEFLLLKQTVLKILEKLNRNGPEKIMDSYIEVSRIDEFLAVPRLLLRSTTMKKVLVKLQSSPRSKIRNVYNKYNIFLIFAKVSELRSWSVYGTSLHEYVNLVWHNKKIKQTDNSARQNEINTSKIR